MGRSKTLTDRMCSVCGESHKVTNYKNQGTLLCLRHRKQVHKFGAITSIERRHPGVGGVPNDYEDKSTLIIRSHKKVSRVIFDEEDFDKVSQHHWTVLLGRYVRTPKGLSLPRLLMGVVDSQMRVIHKDGNSLNCKKDNLVVKSYYSKYKHSRPGISYSSNEEKYHLYMDLGRYVSLEEAVTIYDEVESFLSNKGVDVTKRRRKKDINI